MVNNNVHVFIITLLFLITNNTNNPDGCISGLGVASVTMNWPTMQQPCAHALPGVGAPKQDLVSILLLKKSNEAGIRNKF